MIEKRSAERGVKEIVAQRVVRRLFRQRQVAGVVVAHHQALRVADRGEPIHLARVYLRLLLIKAVDEIGCLRAKRYVPLDAERRIAEIAGKRLAGRSWQHRIRLAGAVDLPGPTTRVRQPVRPLEFPIQIVEAVVLEVDDDDVLQFFEVVVGLVRRGIA